MVPALVHGVRVKLWKHPQNGVYYVTWADDRRSRRKSLGTTDERQAMRRFRAFERDMLAGRLRQLDSGPRKTLSDFRSEFLAHIESRVSPATYSLYRVAIDKAVASWGASTLMQHITKRHLENLQSDLLKSGLSKPAANKNYRHVKAALKKAIDWDYIKALKFPPQLREDEHIRFLTTEQIRKLFGTIDDQEFADLVLMALYTGLRSGELLRLSRKDIDNPPGFLRITSEQKNRRETRIPIHDALRPIFERCPQSGRLFGYRDQTHVSHLFKKYADKAGITARFHDLRHTYASHLAMAGEDLKSIQELMRHRSIASTMVYAKVSPGHLAEVNSRLNYGPIPVKK